MNKPAAITLLVIFGNALTFAVCAPLIGLVRMWWLIPAVLAGYTAVSTISARGLKRKYSFGYLKFFLLGVLPAPVLSFLYFISEPVFHHSETPLWVAAASTMEFGGAYAVMFCGSSLVVWGREKFGK